MLQNYSLKFTVICFTPYEIQKYVDSIPLLHTLGYYTYPSITPVLGIPNARYIESEESRTCTNYQGKDKRKTIKFGSSQWYMCIYLGVLSSTGHNSFGNRLNFSVDFSESHFLKMQFIIFKKVEGSKLSYQPHSAHVNFHKIG